MARAEVATLRLWYAGRGVSWVPLLACLTLAAAGAAAPHRWPETAGVLLPVALACCAAAVGFVFDESATAVVHVTPRGAGWRRTTRCAVGVLPALAWSVVVATARGPAVDELGWLLAGLSCQLVALGLAALASRHAVAAPGASIASALAILVLMPLVVGPVAGWVAVLPLGPFGGGVLAFWTGAALLGAGLLARGVRPGLRP